MVTEVVMTVWIRLVQGSEKVKDQDVDEAHGKSDRVYLYFHFYLVKQFFARIFNFIKPKTF